MSTTDRPAATDVPPARRIMPFIMRSRNESAVYFEQELDLTRTLPFLEQFNAAHPETKAGIPASDAQDVYDAMMRTFEEFKSENDGRLKAIDA